MSNQFSDKKKKWWNGFRDKNTKVVIDYDIPVAEYGIPRTMRTHNLMSIDPYSEKQVKVMNYMYDMINDKYSHKTMIISGGNGTGKSYLGTAFIHTVAILDSINDCRYHDPRYTDEGRLLRSVSSFNDTAFRFWTDICGVLVLDELGMTQWTPGDKRTIEQILNVRFSNGLPTIVMTNRRPNEIFGPNEGKEPLFSSQLRSRYSSGYRIEFDGPDLRRLNEVRREDPDYDPYF